MARPRKTTGDRLVEHIKAQTMEKLGVDDLSMVHWGPDEGPRLELIKRTADDLEIFERAWAADGEAGLFKVRGSRGQEVVNPLIAEIRQQRTALSNLLKGLRVDIDTPLKTASERG